MTVMIVSQFHSIYARVAQNLPQSTTVLVTGNRETSDEIMHFYMTLKPDIVVVDTQLNGQSCNCLVHRFRNSGWTATIVTVMVSGLSAYQNDRSGDDADYRFEIPGDYDLLCELLSSSSGGRGEVGGREVA